MLFRSSAPIWRLLCLAQVETLAPGSSGASSEILDHVQESHILLQISVLCFLCFLPLFDECRGSLAVEMKDLEMRCPAQLSVEEASLYWPQRSPVLRGHPKLHPNPVALQHNGTDPNPGL